MSALLLPLALLAGALAPAEEPRTYLLSLADVPLKDGESIASFAIETWGVAFQTVCRIPLGWRITAGSSATPDGTLAGEGSHGATFFGDSSPKELRDFVLVSLFDVQKADVENGPQATFKGSATISDANDEHKVMLDYRNIKLVPATRCPGT